MILITSAAPTLSIQSFAFYFVKRFSCHFFTYLLKDSKTVEHYFEIDTGLVYLFTLAGSLMIIQDYQAMIWC